MWGRSARWTRRFRRRTIDSHEVPGEVVQAANHEAWRQTGFGRGARSIDLEPAECERLDETFFRCVAELTASRRGPTVKIEMDIEQVPGSEVVVSKVTRSEPEA